MEEALAEQPTVLGVVGVGIGSAGLGGEPPQVGAVDLDHGIGPRTVPSHQQALGGEQGHLRVVGDGSESAEGGGVVGDAVRSVPVEDGAQRLELDRGAERVTDGTAEQAAAESTGA